MMDDGPRYQVWTRQERSASQLPISIVSKLPFVGWAPEFVRDDDTGNLRPVAGVSDAEFQALPFVRSNATTQHLKDYGWVRGASRVIPRDDPRLASGSFQPDVVPRWEPGTEPEPLHVGGSPVAIVPDGEPWAILSPEAMLAEVDTGLAALSKEAGDAALEAGVSSRGELVAWMAGYVNDSFAGDNTPNAPEAEPAEPVEPKPRRKASK